MYNSSIQICTPVTCDGAGDFYFGYVSTVEGIPSGLAKVSSSGSGTFSGAAALSGDSSMVKVSYNCTPAVSKDRSTVYVAVNNGSFGSGYLCKVSATDLSRQKSVFLTDPSNGGAVAVIDDSTASPAIGPDGDVYYGVLENGWPSRHHDRGWMLHFNSTLTVTKTPGSFGWDDTASMVPAKAVPSYTGTSTYLILTKYNNYADGGIGGDGENKLAVLDPNNQTEKDPILPSVTVMNEVLTVLGPTKNSDLPGVREWCINTAAIDSVTSVAVVNSEDGHVYRWDFTTNSLTATVDLTAATGEAYTPTLIGPDGAVYAINNASLYCCQAAVMNAVGRARGRCRVRGRDGRIEPGHDHAAALSFKGTRTD